MGLLGTSPSEHKARVKNWILSSSVLKEEHYQFMANARKEGAENTSFADWFSKYKN
jgi:hypothetical protein